MSFCFYPQHGHGCPNVGHGPYWSGASLGTLVLRANENQASRQSLLHQLDAERERSSRLWTEVESLKKQLEQAKLELMLVRQTKFAYAGPGMTAS